MAEWRFPQLRVLLFAKAPRPGRVKTRLVPQLSPEAAADLYAGLLQHTLARCLRHSPAPVTLWVDEPHPLFDELAERHGLELGLQCAGNLGVRMAAAARHTLQQGRWPVLVGADCPALSGAYLTRCCEALSGGAEAVVGPATDGGYVLLGLRRYDPRLFNTIPWSSDLVYAVTAARLQSMGWHWHALEPLPDIDRPEDLPLLSQWGIDLPT